MFTGKRQDARYRQPPQVSEGMAAAPEQKRRQDQRSKEDRCHLLRPEPFHRFRQAGWSRSKAECSARTASSV